MKRRRQLVIAAVVTTLTALGITAEAIQVVPYNPQPFPGVSKSVPMGVIPSGKVNLQMVPAVVPKLDASGKVVSFITNPLLSPPE